MKILIGYDGSRGADGALHDLERAGLPVASEVKVIAVGEQWLPPPPPSSYEVAEISFAGGIIGGVVEANREAVQAVEEANALAEQAAQLLRSSVPAWNVSAEARTGSPAREIIRRAEEWEADLIVVGPEGRSALGRLILGSVSQRVVTDAPCSVRVGRANARPKSSARLVIGIDGSAGAGAAVQAVATRNWPKGSEVRLVTLVDPLHMYSTAPEDKFAYARSFHQAAEAGLREAGFVVTFAIESGDPRQLLISEAERWGADSIFVGARGLGRLGRFLLGSISTAVVARAQCSVEVVRKPQPH